MSDVIQLLDTDFFQIGLRFGLLALAIAWMIVLFRRSETRLPIGGALMAAAATGSLLVLGEAFRVEAVGLLVILVGTFVARRLSAPDWAMAAAAVPGSLLLALGTNTTELIWVRVALAVVVPLAGYLITDFERRYENVGLGLVFYGLAALGLFVAVPDTEWARVLIAVAIPMVFAAWPKPVVSLGAEGSYLVVALLVLFAAQGGATRPASIVGSIACLGLLVIEPLALAMSPTIVGLTASLRRNWAGAVIASLPQFVIVALCSRVAARFTRELPALVIVVVVYMATLAVGLWADPGRSVEARPS